MTFDTVLIANRGEIACRIIRSATELGLKTVAVYSDADRAAPHVREATMAVRLGPAPANESYLRIAAVIEAALTNGAGAIHPGYGFLSENVEAAKAVAAAGLVWLGPTPEQIETFGMKHTAREFAQAANVPMLPGTGLLSGPQEAVAEAEQIGLPVMLKATGGGGGIGMRICETLDDVRDGFDAVAEIASHNFGAGGVFLERLVTRARHVEVQVFGDGEGRVAIFGDRDCSLQRRNQKVIEEAPAPNLPDHVRSEIHQAARRLAESVAYRSAGTVEFIYDPEREEAYFLEMNTRLQVEHPVTEAVFGVDLVALMLRLGRDGAAQLPAEIFATERKPKGHAVEARVYAEDPAKDFAPSPGLVTNATMPTGPGIRVDGWVETGSDVAPDYDPMLAKVIAHAEDRDTAFGNLAKALSETRIDGIVTGLGMLRTICINPIVRDIEHDTKTLSDPTDPDPRIDVVLPGQSSTIQQLPGRLGYWRIGVPPSGPMDPVSAREANLAVGNPADAPILEITTDGPRLRFSHETVVCVTGAKVPVAIDGAAVELWQPATVPAGGELTIGTATLGMRAYLAVRGGFDVPEYLGSAATFASGGLGGHGGRALLAGDVLRPGPAPNNPPFGKIPARRRVPLTNNWVIGVTEGPHAADEFFTRADIAELYQSSFEVSDQPTRSGIRLEGPKPEWAREDGGQAGLHPALIQPTAHSVGALDFHGDHPVILGLDGTSLSGFVSPAVVASGELWKLGQLRPGDQIRFSAVAESEANEYGAMLIPGSGRGDHDSGILARREPGFDGETRLWPAATYRRAGDAGLLVEYGQDVPDISLRLRVQALQTKLGEANLPGIRELTAGVRSLHVQIDPRQLHPSELLETVRVLENELPATRDLEVSSRKVSLPLAWDDPAIEEAIEQYAANLRQEAPWLPTNIEFIRRINGLESVADVERIVFDAEYLVLALGDDQLGTPLATPVDPRHRLVAPRYNPARAWTAEGSVGLTGALLGIQGSAGPGSAQLVGRTIQVWNQFRHSGFPDDQPWALRPFDRISWYPVSAEELLELRADMDAGRAKIETLEGTFSYIGYRDLLARERDAINARQEAQQAALEEEMERWRESGELNRSFGDAAVAAPVDEVALPAGCTALTSPFAASVWKVETEVGATVEADQVLLVLEAMKMENPVLSPTAGNIRELYVSPGEQVTAGQTLAALEAD